jgi:hypothetical protein
MRICESIPVSSMCRLVGSGMVPLYSIAARNAPFGRESFIDPFDLSVVGLDSVSLEELGCMAIRSLIGHSCHKQWEPSV